MTLSILYVIKLNYLITHITLMIINKKDIVINSISNLRKKQFIDDETKQHFMNNQIEQDDTKYWRYGVLRNYDNMYVSIIPKEKNDKKIGLILSYIIVLKEWGKPFRFIELLDSFYNNNNLGFRMMEKYMKQYSKKLIPLHIIKCSVNYWKKYFKKYFNIETIDEFKTFIEIHNLNTYENKISWENLMKTI